MFFYFSVTKTTWADSWLDFSQPCSIDLRVMKWRSPWSILDSPVILPYILNTIWCMNIILWDSESVCSMFDLKINVRHFDLYFVVQWFFPFILNTIWGMNIILWDYESVWPDIWPENICRSLWPIFHDPVILPYILKTIWCMNIILWDYESVNWTSKQV